MPKGQKKPQLPFHIWDDNAKQVLPWRRYKTPERAIERMLWLIHQMPVGSILTVYDERNASVYLVILKKISGLYYIDRETYAKAAEVSQPH